ncbi:GerAB/ArcD/ProY family transporter [Caldinitratiruptor microaerophilus]|uniref:Spore germination protein KB n=1 Tax=Caldinitratiruptor microaerophilus TaxID=671077 RepID=A0AA35G8Y8_9FIRM|nr:spore germination protein [Caldinitratiruptor microaerophilus]BDG61550.1 spore germination protein KB [Caldinitratiruptor microaerophilus]
MRHRIRAYQVASFLALYSHVALLFFVPAAMAARAGRDAWLSVLVGAMAALPVVLVVSALASRHRGLSLVEVGQTLLGPWPGRMLGLVWPAFFIFLCSLVIRNVMDFLGMAILRGTPPLFIGASMALLAAYAVYDGIEVLARIGGLAAFVYFASGAVGILLVLNQADFRSALPAVEAGLRAVWDGALPSLGWFGESVILGFLLPHVEPPRMGLRWALGGYAVAAGWLSLVTFLSIVVFGPSLTAMSTYPIFVLVQQVRIGQFFERVEVVLVSVWLTGMFVKVALCLWAAGMGVGHALGIPYRPQTVLVLAGVALGLTQVWAGFPAEANWGVEQWTRITFPLELGVPLLLLVVSTMRGRRSGSREGVQTRGPA